MKKLLNSKLFLIIVCAIVFGSIGVVAGNINASEVDYKNTKLDAAIDDLYNNLNTKIALNTFGTAEYDASYGVRSNSRTTSLTLDSGKYIIYVFGSISGGGNGNLYSDATQNITCSSECSKTKLSGKYVRASGTATTNYGTYTAYSIYYVDIINDSTTVTYVYEATSNNSNGQVALISAIPINEN